MTYEEQLEIIEFLEQTSTIMMQTLHKIKEVPFTCVEAESCKLLAAEAIFKIEKLVKEKIDAT